jgi:hypothetical protein
MQGLARWFVADDRGPGGCATGSAAAQVKELRIGYQPSPIQDASIAMFEAWGAKNGVKIVKVPNSYGVYVEKMTASLTSNSDQYDVIWHNDDWGQTWAHLLEPTDDVEGQQICRQVEHGAGRVRQRARPEHGRADGPDLQRVLLPLRPRQAGGSAEDAGELVTASKKLQADGKVKFGYVGGMSMNNSWFSWFWSMWGNNCSRSPTRSSWCWSARPAAASRRCCA